jgi:predicted exporter
VNARLLSSKPIALAWLLLVALVVALAFRQGANFDSSILSLLPKSDQDPLMHRAGEQMNRDFSERLLIVLSGADEVALRVAVADMAAALAPLDEVARVDWRIDDSDPGRVRKELFPYRFVLLEDGLRERLLQGQDGHLLEQTLARLFSPLAGSGALIEDPFGLYLTLGQRPAAGLNLQISNSLLKVAGSPLPSYLLLVTLAADPFSPALQERLLGTIEAQRLQLAGAIDEIAMSGMLVHAAAGAQQAKREISTIGVGSLIGILVAMLLVFRRLRPLVLLLIPVAVGCLFASAASLLIFHRLHLVTFAFGAGLVGVSVDYALHFLCERQITPARAVLPKILPGLLLGLFSSVAAYAAQAMTPFPGLRQMAVFSVLGLCASWLTVVLWLPLLSGERKLQPLATARHLDRLRQVFPRLDRSPWLIAVLLPLLALACLSIWNGAANDDIRLLQTSPQSLLQQERELQRTLGINGGSRFLLVTAPTLEACLQFEEQLRPVLLAMQRDGVFDGVRMLSSSLPSRARQADNAALVGKLYQRQLEPLFARLQLPPARLQQARAELEQAASNRLTPERWQQLSGNGASRNLLIAPGPAQAIPMQATPELAATAMAATAIRFQGELSDDAVRTLTRLAGELSWLSFVDQVQSVSTVLGKYRVQVAGWVVLAYLGVFGVLLLRYRRELWRIIVPPLVASLVTLAILVQVQQGINLFHLMALILVLGIGLDMGIFLAETGEAPHTWLAVSLSAFTSLLAFGLLALSDTPVLHHFGLTVALGLSLVWLLAPLMRRH